jgi:ADP-ribosyl-[dinitrogen reductase] hydrolase
MFISTPGRVEGMLLGLAVGDALGAPFEGGPERTLPVREMLEGGLHARKAGEVTDDTLQAMAVAGSLVHCRGYCPGDLVTRLIAGYATASEWYGPTSSAVFDLVIAGCDPFHAARVIHAHKPGRETNGSVMRGAPLGVAFSGPELEEVSLSCSQLTHAGNTSGWCSSFVNRMVSGLIRGISKKEAWHDACRHCKDRNVLFRLGNWSDFPPVPAPDALLSTHAALWCFLATNTFPDAVGTAAALGGDADTVAAICGAIAGSCYGISAVPSSLTRGLQYRESLHVLAGQLFETFHPTRSRADLRIF